MYCAILIDGYMRKATLCMHVPVCVCQHPPANESTCTPVNSFDLYTAMYFIQIQVDLWFVSVYLSSSINFSC